jgi:hypothetical protein
VSDLDFKARCFELESLGYAITEKNHNNNTAVAKKGRRIINVGGEK